MVKCLDSDRSCFLGFMTDSSGILVKIMFIRSTEYNDRLSFKDKIFYESFPLMK